MLTGVFGFLTTRQRTSSSGSVARVVRMLTGVFGFSDTSVRKYSRGSVARVVRASAGVLGSRRPQCAYP